MQTADMREAKTQYATTICCMGAGYVGGSAMAVLASHCPDVRVLVVDVHAARIAQWNRGDLELPIFEPGLAELVAATRGRNLFFRADIDACLAEADIVFLCVDTPTKTQGVGAGLAPDTSRCEDCARRIAKAATRDTIVVEKSTVPVRTADAVLEVLRANADASKKVHFQVLSNPEFLSEGTALTDFAAPDRVLIGGEDSAEGQAAVNKLVGIYERWVPRDRILTAGVWSSELAKLVANAFLAQRLSSINSISAICEATGANVHEVAHAVGADARIGNRYLGASLGFGGASFQKDVLSLVYLAESLHLPEVAEYWRNVVEINDFQKDRFVSTMLHAMYNSVTLKKICVFGFAHKKNTSDARETPAGSVIRALVIERARVAIYDPRVKAEAIETELIRQGLDVETIHEYVTICSDPYEAAEHAHAVIAVTAWEGLHMLDYDKVYESMTKPAFFFDGRNVLPHQHLQNLGAKVHAIGQALID